MPSSNIPVRALNVALSGVAIIDGLSVAERAKYADADKLSALIAGIEPQWVGPIYQCDSKYAYFDALKDLTARAENGEFYLVHFECHGSPDGLEMDTDDVPWSEQNGRLSTLNRAMRDQLVIDLSACNGIHASKITGSPDEPPPFYAVIGPAKTIAMECASVITRTFYEEYLAGPDHVLDHAIARANQRLGADVLLGLRASVYAHEMAAGYVFRPVATENDVVECGPDGTVTIRSR